MVALSAVLADQLLTVLAFWGDRRTKTPILIIWVASFGGALHAAVTSYYYLEIGASEIDIGYIGFIMSLGFAMAPLCFDF